MAGCLGRQRSAARAPGVEVRSASAAVPCQGDARAQVEASRMIDEKIKALAVIQTLFLTGPLGCVGALWSEPITTPKYSDPGIAATRMGCLCLL
jgi:hypothetical protein